MIKSEYVIEDFKELISEITEDYDLKNTHPSYENKNYRK